MEAIIELVIVGMNLLLASAVVVCCIIAIGKKKERLLTQPDKLTAKLTCMQDSAKENFDIEIPVYHDASQDSLPHTPEAFPHRHTGSNS